MEYRSELKTNLRDQQSLGTFDKTTLPQARGRTDLPDRFKLERCVLSYSDLHREVTKSGKDVSPKFSGNCQEQHTNRKGNEEDELVKYMSSLPTYLERGKNSQDKVLNVGVLDWGRLEKWQYSHKQMPHRGARSSLSSSNFSSSFSTDASSSHSSSDYISSPSPKTRRPSLQFHLMSSPIEGYSQAVKSFGEGVQRSHDRKDAQSNNLNEQGKFVRADTSLAKNHQDINLEEWKRSKDSDAKIDQETGTLRDGVRYEVASSMKVKMKTQDGQFMNRAEKPQERSPIVVDQDVPGEQKPVVLLVPRDLAQNDFSGVSSLTDRTTLFGQRPAEDRRRSFSERSKDTELVPDFPNSNTLPSEVDINQCLLMKRPGSTDAKIDNLSSERSHMAPCSAKIGICKSRYENEDRKSTVTTNKPNTNRLFLGSDPKVSKLEPEKVRSTSPFRRLSFSMSRISKNSSSKEASALPQLNPTHISAQSGSGNTVASACLDTSSSDKINATSRARSSPLRRLLDPILKPKPANCRNIGEPLPKDSISKERASKSSDGRPYSSSVDAQSTRVKVGMTSRRTININDSLQEKQHGSPSVQALLRVAVKNGQPLFTFAVDNERDILAATMKKLSSSRKEDYSCIYTFFTIQEVKRKNVRWLNQGGKGPSHDYIPNVVAQMKVCGSYFSYLTGEKYVNQFGTREYVLSAVELRQADQQTSDFEPNDELAAIVVKIPMRISRSSLINGYQGDKPKDLTEVGLKENLSEAPFDCNSGKNVHNWPYVGGPDVNATVILPSGVHTVPLKGEPSSLIQRWKSGGSCDCGGWDLGCKLRVVANQNQLIKKAGSSNACPMANQFELFSQGGVHENHPCFSLAPFKDGIYSVEFNSSISLLQAFSICIAVLDSRKPCDFSESSNFCEQKAYGESVLIQNDGTRVSDGVEAKVPAIYVSYPPHSPVGRV